jgi:hypothetical protein
MRNRGVKDELDTMVAIDNRSIRPHLERSVLAWFQRVDQFLVRQFSIRVEF